MKSDAAQPQKASSANGLGAECTSVPSGTGALLSQGRFLAFSLCAIALALLMYLPSQYVNHRFPDWPVLRQGIIFLAVLLLLSPAVYVAKAVRQLAVLRAGTMLSIGMLLMGATLDLTRQIQLAAYWPLVGSESAVGHALRGMLLWVGAAMLMGTLYLTVIELAKARQKSDEAFRDLLNEVAGKQAAEQSLRENALRLSEAQHIAHLGNWELNHQTDTIAWSDEIFKIIEIDRGRAGASWEAFLAAIHPDDRDKVRLAFAQTWEAAQPFTGSHRLLMSDGRVKQVHSHCETHFTQDGKRLRSIGTIQDITERKQAEAERAKLEDQLHQAQKLESIGQLAGGVAHDFNNIMAATMMQLSFLQKNKSLDSEAQEMVMELMADAKRAASLTGQLLMFSRKSVLEIIVLDLNDVVGNLLKMLGRLIGEQIRLRFERFDALPPVKADARMIEQIIMNLAVNARDAMPKGGLLTIRLDPIQIDAEQEKKRLKVSPGLFVCLSVVDTGCGMDEDTLQHIFEPFFTTKEIGKGTGLGLAAVHGIMAQHQGWVEVESQAGKGSTFKVFFPAATKEMAVPKQKGQAEVLRGRETILLVEDEAGLRRLVVQGLGQMGYRVFEADNGRTALKLWQEHGRQIDLLFSDMMMPEGITGLDLAEMLKKEKPDLKVIISSGYNMELAGQGAQAAGGMLYLQKPCELEVLSRSIRKCLDSA